MHGRVPAALLAEALLLAGDDDDGRLGVRLAHLVPAVVVAALGQVRVAPFDRARRHRLMRLPGPRSLRRRGGGRRGRQRRSRRGRGRRLPASRAAKLEVKRAAAAARADHRAQVPRRHLGVPVHELAERGTAKTTNRYVYGGRLGIFSYRDSPADSGFPWACDGCLKWCVAWKGFFLHYNCAVSDNRCSAHLP
jgi:hypothetical protein